MHTAPLFWNMHSILKIKPSKSRKYPDQEKLLNKRSELTSKYRHENKYLLKY